MNKKNKASKLINTALGLIMIIAVILCSPLFGYGMGLAPREQRKAAAEAAPGFSTGYVAVPAASASATPRPTAQPTPELVVLPSAPPVPDPTPEPTRPPQTVRQPVQQAVQQQTQANWTPEEALEGEAENAEEAVESAGEGEQPENTYGIGEQTTTSQDGTQYIATEGADIVFAGSGTTDAGTTDTGTTDTAATESYDTVTESGYAPSEAFTQDSAETEAFTFG